MRGGTGDQRCGRQAGGAVVRALAGVWMLAVRVGWSAPDSELGGPSDVAVLAPGTELSTLTLGNGDRKRLADFLKALPPDHTAEVEWQTVAPGGEAIRHIIRITERNAAGARDGRELNYGDWYQQPHRVAHYRNDKQHGAEQLFDRGGKTLRTEILWEEGRMHGLRRTFHPDGTVQSETPHMKGEPHGESRTFDMKGRVIRTVPFVKGKRHGASVDYWAEAPEVVQRRIPYRDGEVHGLATAYYLSGKIKWECPFKENKQHGIEKHYAADGTVEKTVQWRDGEQVPAAEGE